MYQSTLVFLHGWGGNHNSWFPITEKLKKQYKIYAPDLPGFSNTPISRPYNVNDFDNFLEKYLKDNKIVSPILIGHSFGGTIATNFATTHSISKLVLVDAAIVRPTQTLSQKIIASFSPIMKPIISPIRPFLYRLLKLNNSDYYQITNPNLKKTFQTIIRQDLTDKLPHIKIPTLIIWGDKDTSTPLSDAQIIHSQISNSKLIVYPNSTHFAYLEHPDQFIKDLKLFIK